MREIFGFGAKVSAVLGVLICLVAGVVRIVASPYLAGFEALTLFIGGIAVMLFSALLKLELIHLDIRK